VITSLLPDSVVTVETWHDLVDTTLFPEEEVSLGRAVKSRRHEFITGRACARAALARLGIPPVAIPTGSRGEPLWPRGVVGSITHCAGYRACAVARETQVAAVGIDAEPNAPLPTGVLEAVASKAERERLAGADPAISLDRVLFSAKESVYKAWFPLAGRPLGFEDVDLSVDRETSEFRAQLLVQGPDVGGRTLTGFSGSWGIVDGVILTTVVVAT
jgi:4'-phosphopantetheinyl transferase EntD